MRNIIISDIHGCSEPLKKILDRVQPDPASDRLIFLGDLFDRGPDSWEVFQIIKGLEKSFGERFVFLRGNHEDYLIQERLPHQLFAVWERVGRQATVRSFQQHGERMEDCAPWIREHSVLFYKGDGFQCVHAGLKIDPPELNDHYTLMHDHEIAMENRYAGPFTVVGHIALYTPVWFAGNCRDEELIPEETPALLPDHGALCIDAGCGKGGRLIAMVVESNQYTLYGAAES